MRVVKSFRNITLSMNSGTNILISIQVVPNLGLCVSVFDILDSEEQYLYHGHSASFVRVCFRMVIFRPFVGEIITGKIRKNSKEGIQVTLGFFDDIFIPSDCLMKPAHL